MNGSSRWIALFGAFGAVLTFLFSVSRNKLGTTLLHSFYAFLAFAALALLVRFVLSVLLRPALTPPAAEERGAMLDMVTPDDDNLSEMLKEQWADGKEKPVAGFQPLNPAKLVSLSQPKTEEVVQAVRRMTNE